jgi:putative exosortase-associated protein (TIGR04073 family)
MNTRMMVAGLVAVTLIGALTALAEVDVDTAAQATLMTYQPRTADMFFEKWGFKMTRGVMNCATCWVELPRNIHVETSENAIVGPFVGFGKGLGLTVTRAVAGVMDLATFGTVDDTYTLYDRYAFPYFVWQGWSKSERM